MTYSNYTRIYDKAFFECPVLKDLKAGEYVLLYAIMARANYAEKKNFVGGMTITLRKKEKAEICEELKISIKTLEKYISTLSKGKIIRRVPEDTKGGVYQLNPFVVGKGEESKVEMLRKWCVEYGWFCKGKTDEDKKKDFTKEMEELEKWEKTLYRGDLAEKRLIISGTQKEREYVSVAAQNMKQNM